MFILFTIKIEISKKLIFPILAGKLESFATAWEFTYKIYQICLIDRWFYTDVIYFQIGMNLHSLSYGYLVPLDCQQMKPILLGIAIVYSRERSVCLIIDQTDQVPYHKFNWVPKFGRIQINRFQPRNFLQHKLNFFYKLQSYILINEL